MRKLLMEDFYVEINLQKKVFAICPNILNGNAITNHL